MKQMKRSELETPPLIKGIFSNEHCATSRYEVFLIVGVALYWAAMLLYISHLQQAPSDTETINPLFASVSTALMACLVTLCVHVFERYRAQRIFLLISLLLLVVGSLFPLLIAAGAMEPYPAMYVTATTWGLAKCALMLFWTLRLTALDAHTALAAIIRIVPLTVVIYLLGVAVTDSTFLWVAIRVLSFISLMLLFFLPEVSLSKRTFKKTRKKECKRFYAGRILFGLSIGIIIGIRPLGALNVSEDISLISHMAALGLAVVVCAIAVVSRRKGTGKVEPYLFLFPLAVSGILIFPFIYMGTSMLSQMSVPLIYSSYVILATAQMSAYKERFGMSTAIMAFTERMTMMVFWAVGDWIGLQILSLLGPSADTANICALIALIMSYVIVLAATFTLQRFQARPILPDEVKSAPSIQEICEKLSDENGLTPREREVIFLIAQGHTLPFIERELSISNGTAKAHASHIYQKLGIHKKEELIEMVQKSLK